MNNKASTMGDLPHYVRLLAFALGSLILGTSTAVAQSPPALIPTLAAGDLPIYPRPLLAMGIQGTVTFCVRTDGERVVSVEAEDGPLGLRQLCAPYPASWVFKKHAPTEFRVSLTYGLQGCCYDCPPLNGTLLLNLPETDLIHTPSTCITAVKLGPDGKPIVHWPIMPYPPIIRAAKALVFPEAARVSGIDGVVSLRVATDGWRIEEVSVECGDPLLAPDSVAFVKSWQMQAHIPISFPVTIHYELVDCPQCPANGTVEMKLPNEVVVVAPRAIPAIPATVTATK